MEGAKETGSEIRNKAEKKAIEEKILHGNEPMTDLERLNFELRIHHIELEMQNEQLRKTRRELEKSNARYTALFDSAPVGYVTLDGEGRVVEANLAAEDMLGLERTRMEGKKFSKYVDREYREEFMHHQERALKTGERVVSELKMVRPDGRDMFVRMASLACGKEETRNFPCRTTMEDITERRRAEESLRESEERFRIALENSPTCVFTMNRDLRFTWLYNSQFGDDPEYINGKTCEEFLASEDARPLTEMSRDVMETGEGKRFEWSFSRDGKFKIMHCSLQPMCDEKGNITGVTGAFTDITEQRAMEENLDRLLKEKEAMSGHEVKNLLIPLHVNVESLLMTSLAALSSEQIELILKIRESANKAFAFITFFNRMRDVESGTFTLRKTPESFENVILRVMEELSPLAERHDVNIEFICDGGKFVMDMDINMMPGVIFNLVLNAIEHVAGCVKPEDKKVRVKLHSTKKSVSVSIHNRGEPIPEDQLATLFQDPHAGQGKRESPGLGTSYAWLVTRAHDGAITVASTEKEGTVVTLKFKTA